MLCFSVHPLYVERTIWRSAPCAGKCVHRCKFNFNQILTCRLWHMCTDGRENKHTHSELMPKATQLHLSSSSCPQQPERVNNVRPYKRSHVYRWRDDYGGEWHRNVNTSGYRRVWMSHTQRGTRGTVTFSKMPITDNSAGSWMGLKSGSPNFTVKTHQSTFNMTTKKKNVSVILVSMCLLIYA